MKRDRLLIIASIAVGTALLACMLSSAFAVLIDPLPFPQANHIVAVNTVRNGSRLSSSAPDYHDLSKAGGPLEGSVYTRFLGTSAEIGGHPESVYSVRFEGNLFTVFQKPPVLGGPSDLDSGQQRNTPAAILSYPTWVKFFDHDPRVVGKLIHIGTGAYEVRAVLPPEYQFALDADIWVAQNATEVDRTNRDGRIFARLASGTSVASANAYLETVASSLQAQAADTNKEITFELELLRDSLAGESKLLLYLLALGAAMVLCVAYFNAYQLLAAKAQATIMRWRICLALGASRKRLFRDMLKEPLLLSVIGCSLGLLWSLWGMQVLRALGPTDIPRIADSRLVWQVDLVSFVLSLLAAVLFTLLMLMRTLSLEAIGPFHGGGSNNGASIHHAFQAKKQSLLIVQIALSTTLLISIGMVATALHKATNSSLGLNADGISVTDLSLKQPTNTVAGTEYVNQMVRSVAALPGVENAAVTSSTPFQGRSYRNMFTTSETGQKGKQLQYAATSPEFFDTLQTRVLRGRRFTDSDNSDSDRVAILNQAAAQALFGNGDSMNQRVRAGSGTNAATMEVVGLVENIRQDPTTVVAPPIVYLPLGQTKTYSVSFVVRAKIPLANADIKPRIWAISANQAVGTTVQLVDLIDASLRRIRYMAFLMMLFAGVTMVLSALGIYAAVAQWLSTSQREIALHLALGATYSQIRNSILTRIMVITGIALAVGLAAALAIRNTMEALLYGVQPQMSTVVAFAALLLGSVALLSSYIPALRSKFTDPATLLRSE